jgi:hypothetical protein
MALHALQQDGARKAPSLRAAPRWRQRAWGLSRWNPPFARRAGKRSLLEAVSSRTQ